MSCASLRGCARSGFGLTGCYLWTDAFGLVLLVSLYGAPNEEPYLDGAMELVAEVDRVLGRKRGIRSGEKPDRDGQYFHYLAMWLYALDVLGRYEPAYRDKGIARVPSTGLSSCRAAVLSGK